MMWMPNLMKRYLLFLSIVGLGMYLILHSFQNAVNVENLKNLKEDVRKFINKKMKNMASDFSMNDNFEVEMLNWTVTPEDLETKQMRNRTVIQAFEVEQLRRSTIIEEACPHMGLEDIDFLIANKAWTLRSFLVDDKHKQLFCFLPKVANTNWKKVWMGLLGAKGVNVSNVLDINFAEAHDSMRYTQLQNQNLSNEELKHKLTNYTKTICVRSPLGRLLSAYKMAIENKGKPMDIDLKIMEKMRGSKSISNIQWGEFLEYAGTVNWKPLREEILEVKRHWSPYTKLCYPCAVKYDYIVKYENLFEEANSYLRSIGAPKELEFPSEPDRKHHDSNSLLDDYMESVTQHQLDVYAEKYKADFKLFEYPQWKL